MIRKIKKIYYCLFSLFLLASCQEETLMDKTAGFQISLQDENVSVETKSIPEELGEPTTDKFDLKIQKEGSSEYLYNGKYTSQTIAASAGTYTISASYGTNPVLALDNPYYFGEEADVVINDGEKKSVTLKCKVANALASVLYDDESQFSEMFSEYGVEIKVESNSVLLKNGTKESAYYRANSKPIFTFKGTIKDNGKKVESVLENEELSKAEYFSAAQHCKLTLSLKPATSGLIPTISKVEATTVTINETIPMEWLPKPKVEGIGFSNNELSFAETEVNDASIKLKLASSLQDLRFKFTFEDKQFEGLNRDTGYLFSNPNDKSIIIEQLGIVVSDDNIKLGELIAKLQTNSGVATNNKIEIDAKANNRWSSEDQKVNRTYSLVCNKPEFTVSAYPGNIWTKEFTMNPLMEDQVTKGDFSKLSANMKYQFSTNGESDWTDLGEDLRKADLTPGKTYYIRGVYRGEIFSDPVSVSTYPIIELENGGLEGSSIVRGSDDAGFFNPKDYGAQYEWPSWATLNALTAGYSWKTAYSFNSRSGTRPTNDKPEGVSGNAAVRIITLAYGGGGTDSNPKNFTHSELFLGNFIEDGSIKNYGIPYSSRPTALRFFYKCISNMNNDVSEVKIQIYNDQILLGEGSLQIGAKDSYEEKVLLINYKNDINSLLLIPNKLSIIFKSGIKENLSKSDLKQFGSGVTNSQEDPMWRGNELFVDDVSLVYGM